jgi:hypothetical protein
MTESLPITTELKAPLLETEPQASPVVMEIKKVSKGGAKEKTTKQFLDDHVSNSKDFGQSLVDSISRLISETKEEGAKKPTKKKKKKMTPEMLEQCKRNLAKGRETRRKKKEAEAGGAPQPKVTPQAKPEPKAEPVPTPTPKPQEPKPMPTPVVPQADPEPERLTVKLTDLLF